MMLHFILDVTSVVCLVTITDTSCPNPPSNKPDITTYDSNEAYPIRQITKELRLYPDIKRQINKAQKKLPNVSVVRRRKREVDINQYFDEDPDDRAHRFLLNFFGINIPRHTVIPIEERLGPPIEISKEDFNTLTEKHKRIGHETVMEVSEDEFHALVEKHGGQVEKMVEIINVPASSGEVMWKHVPVADNVNWQTNGVGKVWHDVSTDDINHGRDVQIDSQKGLKSANIPVTLPTRVVDTRVWQGIQPQIHTINQDAWARNDMTPKCITSIQFFSFKTKVSFQNTECFVLNNFKNRNFSYVNCRRPCSDNTTSSEHTCKSSSIKTYNVWFYCKNLQHKLQNYILKLPQRCE